MSLRFAALLLTSLVAIAPATGQAAPRADARSAPAVVASALDIKVTTEAQRRALLQLLAAEQDYARTLAINEVDQGSSDLKGDRAFAEETEHQTFRRLLSSLMSGDPRLDFTDFAVTDGALNAAYGEVMAVSDPSLLAWGSVDKSGIRRTELAWLAYRDAFVAFAELVRPDAASALKAELTTRRAVSLEGFLAD
jgi:hypothetical protein